MAPSYPQIPNSPSTAGSVLSSASRLQNYRQEDVVHALMAHLQERENDLKKASVEMRAAYERQLQLEREGVELRRVVDSQRTFIHQRDDKIMALEQMLTQEAGERESDVRQLNAEIDGALGRQRLFEKQGAELQHVVEQQRNVLKQREDRILLLEQLHVQKDRDAKEGEEKLAEAADLLETLEARKKKYEENEESANYFISEQKAELEQRTDQISELKSELEETRTKQNTLLGSAESFQKKYEESVLKLDYANSELVDLRAQVEAEDKKVKSKEWIIESFKSESKEERQRVKAHIGSLNKTIEFYEKECKGEGIDVNELIAKQNKFDDHIAALEGKIQQLMKENEKLDSLAIQKSMNRIRDQDQEINLYGRPIFDVDCGGNSMCETQTVASSLSDAGCTIPTYTTCAYSRAEKDEVENKLRQQATSFDNFLDDLKNGIDSIETEGLCSCDN